MQLLCHTLSYIETKAFVHQLSVLCKLLSINYHLSLSPSLSLFPLLLYPDITVLQWPFFWYSFAFFNCHKNHFHNTKTIVSKNPIWKTKQILIILCWVWHSPPYKTCIILRRHKTATTLYVNFIIIEYCSSWYIPSLLQYQLMQCFSKSF